MNIAIEVITLQTPFLYKTNYIIIIFKYSLEVGTIMF